MFIAHLGGITVEDDNVGDNGIIFDDSLAEFDDGAGEWDDAWGLFLFDGYLDTYNYFVDPFEVTLDFSGMDTVALYGLRASDIEFELYDNDGEEVVYSNSADLTIASGVYKRNHIETMTAYDNASLTITITHDDENYVRCGTIAIGQRVSLGRTKNYARLGFVDYSIKTTDEYGRTYLSQGNWLNKPEITVGLDYDEIDNVYDELVVGRGELLIIEANESDTAYDMLQIYGYIKDWRIIADSNNIVTLSFTVNSGI